MGWGSEYALHVPPGYIEVIGGFEDNNTLTLEISHCPLKWTVSPSGADMLEQEFPSRFKYSFTSEPDKGPLLIFNLRSAELIAQSWNPTRKEGNPVQVIDREAYSFY